jgi:hypothetical protein
MIKLFFARLYLSVPLEVLQPFKTILNIFFAINIYKNVYIKYTYKMLCNRDVDVDENF